MRKRKQMVDNPDTMNVVYNTTQYNTFIHSVSFAENYI